MLRRHLVFESVPTSVYTRSPPFPPQTRDHLRTAPGPTEEEALALTVRAHPTTGPLGGRSPMAVAVALAAVAPVWMTRADIFIRFA